LSVNVPHTYSELGFIIGISVVGFIIGVTAFGFTIGLSVVGFTIGVTIVGVDVRDPILIVLDLKLVTKNRPSWDSIIGV
jgi:hypothetical protein